MKLYPLYAMPIPIEVSIQQHLDDIIFGKIPEPKECCPRCFSTPATFKLHECRKRAFRYIAGNLVRVLSIGCRQDLRNTDQSPFWCRKFVFPGEAGQDIFIVCFNLV